MLTVIALLVGIVAGAFGTWGWLRTVSASRLRLAEDKRRAILSEAERESETTRREVQIEAREHAVKLRADIEAEIRFIEAEHHQCLHRKQRQKHVGVDVGDDARLRDQRMRGEVP